MSAVSKECLHFYRPYAREKRKNMAKPLHNHCCISLVIHSCLFLSQMYNHPSSSVSQTHRNRQGTQRKKSIRIRCKIRRQQDEVSNSEPEWEKKNSVREQCSTPRNIWHYSTKDTLTIKHHPVELMEALSATSETLYPGRFEPYFS